MIVHRDAANNLSIGNAGKLNGIQVEFRPSHAVPVGEVTVMLSHVPADHYVVLARTEPTLEQMATAISAFIEKTAQNKTRKRT